MGGEARREGLIEKGGEDEEGDTKGRGEIGYGVKTSRGNKRRDAKVRCEGVIGGGGARMK